ncbi:hypothetical protein [Lentzea guizhouensis]|nr:hypothetical protein [Lentzea guizhouensis]
MTRKLAAKAVVALGLSLGVLTATSGTALAYNFPFPGCGASEYYDVRSQTKATFSHIDGSTYWYKITWGGKPINSNPNHPDNWSGCTR